MFKHKRRLSFCSLVFTLVGGLSACSSNKNSESAVGGQEDAALQETMASSESGGVNQQSSGGGAQYSGEARSPRIKQKPFKKDGFWMNAFYFVRSPEENWENLSQTLYGRPDRAKLIKHWNGTKTLAPGTFVYYNSPLRPDDGDNMKVFAEDFGYSLEQYPVEAGDTLSSIAQKRFGQIMSWKEIAAINPELVNPNRIEIGQNLRIQPAQIDTQSTVSKLLAQASNPSAAAAGQTDTLPPPEVDAANPPPSHDASPPQATAPPAMAKKEMNRPGTSSFSLGHWKDWLNNDLLIKITFGVMILSILGIVIRRRKQKKNADEWNEAAENVTKFDQTKTGL